MHTSVPVQLALLLTSCTLAHAAEQEFVAGLRERGLYRLAEVYCRRELESDKLTPRARAEVTIELSLMSTARAFDAPSGDRAPHWREAHRVLDEFRTGSRAEFALLIDLQDALHLLRQAELDRLEQPGAVARSDKEPLKALVRSAISELRDVADKIELRRREQSQGPSRDAEFSADELVSLERHVQLALAQAYREQGLVYSPGSADRINALQQAAEALGRLASAEPPDDIAWRARVALAEALAELHRAEDGLRLVATWMEVGPTERIAAQLIAGQIQLLITAGRTDDAEQLAARQPPGQSPEIDLARLQLLLTNHASANTSAIDALLTVVRQTHPPQWVRRAEALVGRTFADSGAVDSAAGQVHAAEHYFHAGQLPAAIAAYDSAAELYRQEQNRDAVFAAERAAAAILQQQHDYAGAAERFRRLALGSLDRDASAGDHREAILCLAEVVRATHAGNRSAQLAAYIEACREHLRHWSATATATEVRYWLGQSLTGRGQWSAAIEVLEEIPNAAAEFQPAMALLAAAYRHQATATQRASERRKLVAAATARLQPVVTGADNRWPAEWTGAQRTIELELARMHLATDPPNAAYAEGMLRAALVGEPPPGDQWRNQATPLRAMALVASGKTAEAIDLLRQSSIGEAGGSLEGLVAELVGQLPELVGRPTERAAVGQLILAAIEVAGDVTVEWKQPVDRYRAAALAAIANEAEARRLYAMLVQEHPRDGDLQEEYAQLLSASSSAADRQQALTAWARVESGSQPGAARWRRARSARIKLLTTLGRRQEAEILQRLTRVLYPE